MEKKGNLKWILHKLTSLSISLPYLVPVKKGSLHLDEVEVKRLGYSFEVWNKMCEELVQKFQLLCVYTK